MQGIKVIRSLDSTSFTESTTKTIQIPKSYIAGFLIDAELDVTTTSSASTITAQSLARTVLKTVRVVLGGSDVRYNVTGNFLNLQNVYLTGNATDTTIDNSVAANKTQRISLFFPTSTINQTVNFGDTTLNASQSDTAILEYTFGSAADVDPAGNSAINSGTVKASAIVFEGVTGRSSAPSIAGQRTQTLSLASGSESTLDLATGGQIGNVPLNQYIGLYIIFENSSNALVDAASAISAVNLNAIGDTFIQSNPRELLQQQNFESMASSSDMTGGLFLTLAGSGFGARKLTTRIIAKAPQISQLQLQLTGSATGTATIVSHFSNAPIAV